MYISGFSVNVLTMLAVVLSVGLVVDDAIVVAENIYVRIEQGMSPKEAGIEGSKEIFFAVVSTTITLISVFLPIVFMEGMTGRLFKEFSIVIARFGRYLLVRGPYVYTDVGYQAIEEEREEKLVLSEDRAVLRGIEHDLRQVVERILEP